MGHTLKLEKMDKELAIELIKDVRSWMAQFVNASMFAHEIAAIDTVLSHITTPNKTGLDDSLQEKLIEQPDNQKCLSSKKDMELPTDEQIREMSNEYARKHTEPEAGYVLNRRFGFQNGATWMRDLIQERRAK